MSTTTYIIIMAVCLLLSAYFSATETAFSSANVTRLKMLAEKGNSRAALACRLLERYDKLLSTILIGNNIVNIAMASLATALFVKSFGDAGATLSTIVVTVVVLIFGEISPKSIAKDCAESWAMTAAPFLRCLIWLLMPLNALFSLWKKLLARMFHLDGDNKMSPEELLMLVNEVQQEGSIDKDEGDLLKNAIGFSEQEAQDILIHRVDLAALPVDATKEEVADLFTQTKYSRLLIYREDIDHIIGTIHQKDFYVGCGVTDKPLEEILSPVMFVLENEPISLLLKKLQLAKTQVAVVVDEYGGTEGIIMNIADMKRLEEEYKKLSKNSGMGGGSVVMYGGSSGTKVKGYDQVYVKVDDVNHVGAVEQMIKDIGYQTSSMTQYREDMQKQVASGQMMLGGLAAVSLLVAALNIANTMTMAIYERTKEIGVMKVLGCKLSKIRQMFLIESGTIGFIGGVIGCLFSVLISFVLNNFTV